VENACHYGRRVECWVVSSDDEDSKEREELGDKWKSKQELVGKRVEESFDSAYRQGKFSVSSI